MSEPTRRRRTQYQQNDERSLVEQPRKRQFDDEYDDDQEQYGRSRPHQQPQRAPRRDEAYYDHPRPEYYQPQAAPPINVIVNNTNTNTNTNIAGYGASGNVSVFDGTLLQLIGWSMLGAFITVLSAGICYPWALCMVYGWKINHTVIDGRRLRFSGSAVGLFGNWIKWLLLTLITAGIYGFWLGIKLEQWRVKNTHYT